MNKSVWALLFICWGCTSAPKTAQVQVSMVNNGKSVKFKGLDYAILSEINRDSTTGIWKGLLPVFRMPADTDLKNYQPVQPGSYQLKDSSVVFTPDTPFVKSNTYFIRYYKFDTGGDVWDFIKGKKKLGHTPYIDLVFR